MKYNNYKYYCANVIPINIYIFLHVVFLNITVPTLFQYIYHVVFLNIAVLTLFQYIYIHILTCGISKYCCANFIPSLQLFTRLWVFKFLYPGQEPGNTDSSNAQSDIPSCHDDVKSSMVWSGAFSFAQVKILSMRVFSGKLELRRIRSNCCLKGR